MNQFEASGWQLLADNPFTQPVFYEDILPSAPRRLYFSVMPASQCWAWLYFYVLFSGPDMWPLFISSSVWGGRPSDVTGDPSHRVAFCRLANSLPDRAALYLDRLHASSIFIPQDFCLASIVWNILFKSLRPAKQCRPPQLIKRAPEYLQESKPAK